MNSIYFYLYSFFRCAPKNEDASGWAASIVPLFFVMNFLGALYLLEILFSAHVKISNEKIIVGVITICLWAWSYWHYELFGRGKEIIASFSELKNDRRSAVVGGILFFEMLFAVMLPGIIAVIQNPTP
jgi:hypothetical protein